MEDSQKSKISQTEKGGKSRFIVPQLFYGNLRGPIDENVNTNIRHRGKLL